jgi:hypothetical protein
VFVSAFCTAVVPPTNSLSSKQYMTSCTHTHRYKSTTHLIPRARVLDPGDQNRKSTNPKVSTHPTNTTISSAKTAAKTKYRSLAPSEHTCYTSPPNPNRQRRKRQRLRRKRTPNNRTTRPRRIPRRQAACSRCACWKHTARGQRAVRRDERQGPERIIICF